MDGAIVAWLVMGCLVNAGTTKDAATGNPATRLRGPVSKYLLLDSRVIERCDGVRDRDRVRLSICRRRGFDA